MGEWYLKQGGEVSGPYSWEELRFLCDRGKLASGNRVRQGAGGDWLAFETVPGLLASANSTAAVAGSKAIAMKATKANVATGLPSTRASQSQSITAAPMPPSLPARAVEARRRRTTTAIVIGTGLFAVLLLMLAMALLANRGTAIAGGGAGAGDGAVSAGNSPKPTQGGNALGSGEASGDEITVEDGVAAPTPPHAATRGDSSSADPSASEVVAEALPKPDSSTGEDTSTPAAEPPPEQPPPRSAAVIMPLDDDDSPGDEDSNGSPGVTGGSAEFFEIKGKGKRFVYIVDCSPSMAGAPFEKARAELQRSIERLNSGQSFFVIFFDSNEYPQFYPRAAKGLIRASAENKHRSQAWISGFGTLAGGTDPRAALMRALSLRPDAIYLLSDGEFDWDVADEVRAQNRKHIAIHTVSFITRDAEPLLKQIADENRGTYRYVP